MSLSTDVRDNEAKKFRDSSGGPVVAVTFEDQVLLSLIDVSTSSLTYIGEAPRGSLTSAAVWSITQINKVGSVTSIKSSVSLSIWDDRSSLTYE